MRFLLTGAGGLLGGAFAEALRDHEVRTAGRSTLEVHDPPAIRALVAEARPDVVLNCAAHTDVEGAEEDPDPAFAANAVLPGLLASAARSEGAVLLHVSSTGCYGDWKADPYTEDDPLRPTTAHHRSKAAGEAAVRDSGCEHLILRTGWLYGGGPESPKNFVWKRLLEAREKERMLSDSSQQGNPTFVGDVARQALSMLDLKVRGVFNCVAQGAASRFDYVSRIVAAADLPCLVEPGPGFRRRAAVSANETARNHRLDLLGRNDMPQWTESLDSYVRGLVSGHAWRAGRP